MPPARSVWMPSTIMVVAKPLRWKLGDVAIVVMCASSSTIMKPM